MTVVNLFQQGHSIMSDPSSGITFPIVQEAMPACHISTDLVRGMPTAMPPPAGASHARRRERLTRVIDEVASVSGGVRGAVAINPLQLSPAAAGAAATRGAKRATTLYAAQGAKLGIRATTLYAAKGAKIGICATTLYAARRRGLEWWWERRWRPRWVRRQGSAWVTVPGRRLDRVGW